MSVSKDFLLSVYERCNEHLKEQSTKRDQAIAFYLVVISFYFGSYSAISKLLVSPYSPIFFNVVICLISGMTIRTLSGLRSWHMQYANSALALNKVISGIENRVILGMTLISGFPVVMLVKEVMSLLKVSNKEIIVLVECAFYLAYVVYYFYNTIMIIRESANHKTWIVNFE